MLDGTIESEPPSCPAHEGRTASAAAAPGLRAIDLSDPAGLVAPDDLARIRAWTAAAAEHLHLSGEARIRIVADPEMAAAHERYAHVPGTTDVLTFDLRTPGDRDADPRRMDVDILVCADEARRQAARRDHGAAHELTLYILHGLLHCLGHDDHDQAAYAHMHALEDRVLTAIGLGPVFAATDRSAT